MSRESSAAIRRACVWGGASLLLAGVGVDATGGSLPLPSSLWPDQPRVRSVLNPTTDFSKAEKYELMQGGAGSSKKAFNQNAYSQETQTLDFAGLQRFKLGNALFNKFWVSSPSSTLASDGLGPFFSARACQSCHIKDGRGQRPVAVEKTASLVLQLKRQVNGEWLSDPVYGAQLHTSAVPGVQAEAFVRIEHQRLLRKFKDGTAVVLQQPQYVIEQLAYGEFHPDTVVSPRVASAMPGLGLIEAIETSDILAYADADDRDKNGISGRPNWQVLADGTKRLGRFGHKAAMSSIEQQVTHALLIDMGLSSDDLGDPNGDCTKAQTICAELSNGVQPHLGQSEVPGDMLDLLNFYSSHLALPVRRDVSEASVLVGKKLFYEAGCTGCHVPKHVTAKDAQRAEHRFQLIWPYSDFLLHDMGAELADGAGEGEASSVEWRTAPLWGIGLAKTVNPRSSFLHDGRADTILEAVLWHGGEAAESRNRVLAMQQDERDALVLFMESL